MQVFIIGTPLETAMALDARRLNKQIIECKQILDALKGKKAWSNHPCTLQYKGHIEWLECYMECLMCYRNMHNIGILDCAKNFDRASILDRYCETIKPDFHVQEYFDQMKRRLYTKNSEHYKQWADLGTSYINWYFVDGKWKKYKNGKCLGFYDKIE